VSIISLSAEMYVCRRITEETKGTYRISLDAKHLQDLLMAQISPPPMVNAEVSSASLLINLAYNHFSRLGKESTVIWSDPSCQAAAVTTITLQRLTAWVVTGRARGHGADGLPDQVDEPPAPHAGLRGQQPPQGQLLGLRLPAMPRQGHRGGPSWTDVRWAGRASW
jgi:hypothetical protein